MQKIFLIASLFFLLSASSAHAGIAQPPTTRGLVGYWSMEDCKLNKATDSSGRGNTGTLTNFALTGATSNWVAGKRGSCALNFDGTNDYVAIANESNFDFERTNSFTLSAWVRLTDISATHLFIAKIGAGTSYPGIQFYQLAGGSLILGVISNDGAGNAIYVKSVAPLEINAWAYVAARYSGTSAASGVTLYINGSAVATTTLTNNLTTSILNNTQPSIGSRVVDGAAPMNGSIDEVRIYNRALTGNEIATLYTVGVAKMNTSTAKLQTGTSLASGLVGHWTFDGKYLTSTKAKDTSGFANDGILTGANGKPVSRPGRLGQALAFDGVDDYVISSSLINTSPVTVSAWVKLTSYPAAKGLVTGFVNGIGGAAYDKDLYINTDGRLYFYVYDGAQRTTSAPTSPIPLNTWVHVMGTANGSAAKAYVNGVEVGSVAAGATYTSYTVPNLLIQGTSGLASIAGGYMAATIDDVRVYNRALTASEVTALYKLGR